MIDDITSEGAAYEAWFRSQQGAAYESAWDFARAAWMHRAAHSAASLPDEARKHIEWCELQSARLVNRAYNDPPDISLNVKLGEALQRWLQLPGLLSAAPKPAPNAGIYIPSCGKPLCSEGDHHPLCQRTAPKCSACGGRGVINPVNSGDPQDEVYCPDCAAPKPEKPLRPEPDADGWIEWNGGECPVLGSQVVDVILRGGGHWHTDRADGYYWTHAGDSADIVAYRLARQAQPEGE